MAFKKDPNAVLDYTFDWAPYLTPILDTITAVEWLPSAGIVVGSTSFTTLTATAFVSGGALGETETLTCRISTLGGRVDDRTIELSIVSR